MLFLSSFCGLVAIAGTWWQFCYRCRHCSPAAQAAASPARDRASAWPVSDEAVGFTGVGPTVYDHPWMGQKVISCDRGQEMLLPPTLSDWLAQDNLVLTVLGAVEQMDLGAFYGAYRANSQGRPCDPEMAGGIAVVLVFGGVALVAAERAGVWRSWWRSGR